ncbi:AMP-binding protein [Peterkaempfera bronchialis]|uniref:AMP-dependent synthetase n=1 Tax=Peterkaempfera bronchialis TaxID=2126346 RepID=A0A345ST93_9ACTN|nr:AMP-binding protein [Peterkaempfera bronchialis]AXI76948.1 AMP-dependent synthetase [Peterkaempfera bronchialis]
MELGTTAQRESAAYRCFRAARDHLLGHRDDLEAARAFPRPEGKHFNWALDWFDVEAEDNHATGLRVVDLAADGTLLRETALTFAELREHSNRTAGWLRAQGVARGDRILLLLGNQVALWEVMLAAIKLGAVVIPASTLLTADDLADRVTRGQVRHVISESALTPGFAGQEGDWTRIAVGEPVHGWLDYAAAADHKAEFTPDGLTRAEDPLLLYFTSGTTSLPKLVQHSHRSYPVGHLSTMYWIGLRPGDVHLNVSSPGWAKHAWSNFFAPWNAGCEILIVNQPRFSAKPLLDALVRHKVTSFCAPPTVWRMLLLEDLAAWRPPLRELVGAGEPLNPEVVQRIEQAWGVPLRDGYGQTETTAQIGNTPGQPVKPGSMGRPLPGYDVVLVDVETGEEITAAGVDGELCLPLESSPLGLMVGYQDDPERQADSTAGGRYHTGDVAQRDIDGYYHFSARGDDVFKSSDYRVSPFELESVLIEHPSVAEAAVVPSPDPLRLSVPKAFIVLVPGSKPDAETARSILAWSKQRLAPYKRIRRIEFADLPKTISGKIRRVELRGLEGQAHANRGSAQAAHRREQEFWEEDFQGPGIQ